MMSSISRRATLAGLGLAPLAILQARAAEPQWRAKQYHNQAESNPLHKALVGLWSKVKIETGGRLEVEVFAENNKIQGSDPAALKQLQSGEIQFFTLMGGILSNAVPVMDIQGLPFAFKAPKQVYRVDQGPLGTYLDKECLAKGIRRVRHGLFENGMRQINTRDKPVKTVDDVADMKIRVPDGAMFRDFFETIGAKPTTVNVNQIYQALKEGRVDGQENPLAPIEGFKLYEVTHYISTTNHMWAGFNLLANEEFWSKLPADIRRVIEKNAVTYVDAQRRETDDLNLRLIPKFKAQGMQFISADRQSFKRRLAGQFYPRWRDQFGRKAWSLLESEVGKIG